MDNITLNEEGLVVISHKPNYNNFEGEIVSDIMKDIRGYKYLLDDMERELVETELVALMGEIENE